MGQFTLIHQFLICGMKKVDLIFKIFWESTLKIFFFQNAADVFLGEIACVFRFAQFLGADHLQWLWNPLFKTDFPKSYCVHKSSRVIMPISHIWMVYFSGVRSSHKHSQKLELHVKGLSLSRNDLSVFRSDRTKVSLHSGSTHIPNSIFLAQPPDSEQWAVPHVL